MAGRGNGNRVEMAGRRFGRWLVTDQHRPHQTGSEWLCRCDCGTERWVKAQNLRSNYSVSCGCLRTERQRERHVTEAQIALIGKLWVQQPPLHLDEIVRRVGVSATTVSNVARKELGLPSRVGPGGVGRAVPRPSRPRAVRDFEPERVAATDAESRPVTVRCVGCSGLYRTPIAAPSDCPHCHAAPAWGRKAS